MITKKVIIINDLGLHARAAAKFVSHAGRYSAKIEVARSGRTVNGKSIMGVMMLAASKGTELELTVVGEDEEEAIKDLENLVHNRFGEEK